MSIPTPFNPMGTLGAFIPPGWQPADAMQPASSVYLYDVTFPAVDDVVTLRFKMNVEPVVYGILGYRGASTTDLYKRIAVQQSVNSRVSSYNACINNVTNAPVLTDVNEVELSREGVTVNGAFTAWPRNAFDASYCDLFTIGSCFEFRGMEMSRGGKVVAELVPYTNRTEFALVDRVNRKFFRI